MSTQQQNDDQHDTQKNPLLSSYIGLAFSLFLATLPKNSLSLLPNLRRQVADLSSRLFSAEEQLAQMKSRRREDSKANARVVEIFASHRNAWQAEERRLLLQIDAAAEEAAGLRAKVEELEREKEEMIGFMTRVGAGEGESGGCGSRECYGGVAVEEENFNFSFSEELLGSASSKFWADSPSTVWQDVHYESLESLYHMKHFVSRRESPWKVDGESTGVSSKLKLLEQELLNLENIGTTDLLKVPSLMRKQAKRYQTLTGKIDDLCRRMQASDPCEPTLSPEFRTQRQTEFLLEAFRLQQRASETGQKLMAVQTEIGKSYHGDELGSQTTLTMRRSFDSIRNNLKEVQRNLEIWLARIIGDLEGILTRDGASRAREYYISRYPFVQ